MGIGLVQKQFLLPVGVTLFLVGIGLTFYNATSEVWHMGEGTDHLDDTTWVIRDRTIGFATPWSYDLGTLPGGTRIFARFNTTSYDVGRLNPDPSISRPGLTRHIITDLDTGNVVHTFDMDSVNVIPRPMYKLPATSHYKYTVESVYPILHETTLDPTPRDFHACIQAYELIVVYPYRLVGVPLLIVGLALAAYSKIKK